MHPRSISTQRPSASPWRSRRLLALVGDERLVKQVRRGNQTAFEVFERYSVAILSFCRHMLGSREEAEDAVHHVFAAAYHQLLRDEREIALKAWLYTIARNRCLSILRPDAFGRTPHMGLWRTAGTRPVRQLCARGDTSKPPPRPRRWRCQLSCSASPMMMPSGPRRKQSR
jgi:hypothetical protein